MAEVVIVDSDSKRGKYIRDVIKTRGYKTRLVKTASAASRKMSHRWADVVFMTESAADDSVPWFKFFPDFHGRYEVLPRSHHNVARSYYLILRRLPRLLKPHKSERPSGL